MDACIDIETLGTGVYAPVLSIGAVLFDPHGRLPKTPEGLHLRLELGPQLEAGRQPETLTLEWWAQQSEAARESAFGGFAEGWLPRPTAFTPVEALLRLSWYIESAERMWAHGGPTFDFPILETLYRCSGLAVPWEYNAVRDVRTLIDGKKGKVRGTQHHALWDAYNEATWVQEHYRRQRSLWRRLVG